MITISTDPAALAIFTKLDQANKRFSEKYPGELTAHQPLHTLYGGAQLFTAESIPKICQLALKSLEFYAPDADSLGKALDLPKGPLLWEKIYSRVSAKLKAGAVEDFRIDFEDGYGIRPDAEEDGTAIAAAEQVALAMKAGSLPAFLGIRVKPFNEQFARRSLKTLELFVQTLFTKAGGRLPPNFIITLPKVCIPEQVSAFAELLKILESRLGIRSGDLRFEIMIETPQAIIGQTGMITVPSLVDASQGRCTSVHFGTYDYTAGNDISAAYQLMGHPACDFALQTMKVSLAGRGVWISDGATGILPVPPHRGDNLTRSQLDENFRVVHRAWKMSYDNILHSLRRGIYQGWDLHPGQLPVRYAACYAFFLDGLTAATDRLSNFIAKAAQATLVGDVFDDAATGQGLLNYFLRALSCGAITKDEMLATGLTLAEIQSRSFLTILEGRKSK
jgi:hypothetical protein